MGVKWGAGRECDLDGVGHGRHVGGVLFAFCALCVW